eukprot:5359_1
MKVPAEKISQRKSLINSFSNMGNITSDKSKNGSFEHIGCDCSLYNEYSHCCKKQCFAVNMEKFKMKLFIALKEYNAEYIINIIIQYLPPIFDIVEMETVEDKDYSAYSYLSLVETYSTNKPLCNIWLKTLSLKDVFEPSRKGSFAPGLTLRQFLETKADIKGKHLDKYVTLLKTRGFSSIGFLKTFSNNNLAEIGINKWMHRKKILKELQKIESGSPMKTVVKKPVIKAVLFGDVNNGKSTLLTQFVSNSLLDIDPDMEDWYSQEITIDEQTIVLDIYDFVPYLANGFGRFSIFHDNIIRSSQIFILCFAVNSRNDFDRIKIYRNKILIVKGEEHDDNCGIILCATKCDLKDERVVKRAECIARARKWRVPYIETSGTDNKNVEMLFEQVIYTHWISSSTNCINKTISYDFEISVFLS